MCSSTRALIFTKIEQFIELRRNFKVILNTLLQKMNKVKQEYQLQPNKNNCQFD